MGFYLPSALGLVIYLNNLENGALLNQKFQKFSGIKFLALLRMRTDVKHVPEQ